jgi:hypothetical protein
LDIRIQTPWGLLFKTDRDKTRERERERERKQIQCSGWSRGLKGEANERVEAVVIFRNRREGLSASVGQ